MTRATFFKHFELLADQPDAVAKMRGLVLELAIRGQLVERSSKGEPASKLLEKIKTEKREFLRASKLKEAEALPQICADEAPFKCPSAWEWVRLGSISNRIHYGYTASADHSRQDVRLLRITDIQDNQVNWETVPGCQISAQEATKYALRDNDILIARTGGTIGKTFLVSNVTVKAVFASYLIRVIPSSQISARYLKLFLESPCYWRQLLAKSAGTGQPNVNGEALSGLCISLPPLAEQRRIVAKVDELMALCDELEQRQRARQHASGILQQSALHHLLAAREPQTFAAAWQRVRDHFHLLHDTPDAIPQLRQAILQLAVQGRLVPQNPNDEPVSEHLREIENAKSQFVQRGLMRKSDPLPDVEADEMPYQIPSSWKWVRVGTVGMTQTGSTPPTANRDFFGDFIPFVKPADLTEREINYGGEGISELGVKQSTLIPANSVLMVCIGGSIGKTNLTTRDVCCNQQINALTPFSKTESRYIMSCMKAAWFQEQVKRDAGQTTLPIISKGKWERLPFPLPPLAEQKRIVARVEELLRWCDTLEAQLHQTHTVGAHLLDSTLHHLLAD